MPETIRIVTVDRQSIFRDGLRRLLDAETGFQVIGDAASVADAVRAVTALVPDILLLDMEFHDGSALNVLRPIGQSHPTVRPLLLANVAATAEVIEALRLGARGLVRKDSSTTLLYRAIRCVMGGEYWLQRDGVPQLIDALREFGHGGRTPADTLTRREIGVVAAVAEGATNKDISGQLGLSEQTVKNHLSHIYDKVGVSNRLELALYAIHHHLINQVG